MKKTLFSVALFLLVFAAAYLVRCYLVPGLRIKLAAPPMEYSFASITHMVFFKALLSSLIAVIAAAIPWLTDRKSS